MRLSAVCCAAVLVPSVAFGWGFEAHRRLSSNLHEPFSEGSCLRAFVAQFTSQYSFQDQSCDPDRWRQNEGPECDGRRDTPESCEWPRHYLNVDYADPLESYPRDWEEAKVRFGQYAVANGRVPWRVEQLYGELVQAFEARAISQARDRLAWLSHYVTDASSPMHATRSQPGDLHLRYETQMLATQGRLDALIVAMRQHYGTLGRAHPRDHVFDLLLVGQPLAQTLIHQDIQNGGSLTALYDNSADLTARRWADGLTLLAALIGTAWLEAGAPLLSGMPGGCDAAVPDGQLVLAGYPLPQQVPDAGTAGDGGVDRPDAGPGANGSLPEGGCQGCGAAPAALLPLAGLGLLLRRRRAR
jgi:hypothetical protein